MEYAMAPSNNILPLSARYVLGFFSLYQPSFTVRIRGELIYLPWQHGIRPTRTATVRMAHPAYQFDVPLISRAVPKEFGNFWLAGVVGLRLPGTPEKKTLIAMGTAIANVKGGLKSRFGRERSRKVRLTGGLVNDPQIILEVDP